MIVMIQPIPTFNQHMFLKKFKFASQSKC